MKCVTQSIHAKQSTDQPTGFFLSASNGNGLEMPQLAGSPLGVQFDHNGNPCGWPVTSVVVVDNQRLFVHVFGTDPITGQTIPLCPEHESPTSKKADFPYDLAINQTMVLLFTPAADYTKPTTGLFTDLAYSMESTTTDETQFDPTTMTSFPSLTGCRMQLTVVDIFQADADNHVVISFDMSKSSGVPASMLNAPPTTRVWLNTTGMQVTVQFTPAQMCLYEICYTLTGMPISYVLNNMDPNGIDLANLLVNRELGNYAPSLVKQYGVAPLSGSQVTDIFNCFAVLGPQLQTVVNAITSKDFSLPASDNMLNLCRAAMTMFGRQLYWTQGTGGDGAAYVQGQAKALCNALAIPTIGSITPPNPLNFDVDLTIPHLFSVSTGNILAPVNCAIDGIIGGINDAIGDINNNVIAPINQATCSIATDLVEAKVVTDEVIAVVKQGEKDIATWIGDLDDLVEQGTDDMVTFFKSQTIQSVIACLRNEGQLGSCLLSTFKQDMPKLVQQLIDCLNSDNPGACIAGALEMDMLGTDDLKAAAVQAIENRFSWTKNVFGLGHSTLMTIAIVVGAFFLIGALGGVMYFLDSIFS
eukprot:TRINITY_DN1874_c0_g2_i6.p1 TRINITY_DN1874_c0_g2~~TRINITY_DN1874_c0_g2_i6.p1  ORF type:complete len:585 (+),score=80.55 TRINITY_DN1874_c0_g2_i6:4183-5937(+)